MKTKMKIFAVAVLFIFPLIFMLGCQKESQEPHDFNEQFDNTLEPYILYEIDSIPCDSPYFVRMEFENSELYYSFSDSIIRLIPTYSTGGGKMIGRGYAFRNYSSDETIEISFYKHEKDSIFAFQVANYRFGNPWYSIPGANIEYYRSTGNPNTYYRFLGEGFADSYFWITWLDVHRICGKFKTKMVECCGSDETFWVEGEFSIPRIFF